MCKPTMSSKSGRSREGYMLGYKKLVAKLSQELSRENVKTLAYVYRDKVPPDPAGSDLEPLAVLERLEQADCFSYDHPERLGEIMKVLERKDLSKKVDNFIGNRSETTITDLQVDGPFRPQTLQPVSSAGTAPNPPEPDEQDPPYVYFFPPPPTTATGRHSTVHGTRSSAERESSDGTLSSPTSSASSSTSDSHSRDHLEQDENDPVYDYPRQWLVNLSSELHPLVERTLRLLVAPIRSMISRKCFEMVSAVFDHRISNSQFKLRIDPRGEEDHPSLSTSLLLLKGSTLNSEVPLQAELTMSQPAKKPKGKQREFEMKRKTKATSVYQGLVLMDVPKSSHGRTTQSVVVARFPGIISHEHLLNENIIKAPFLELKLVIRQFPEQ